MNKITIDKDEIKEINEDVFINYEKGNYKVILNIKNNANIFQYLNNTNIEIIYNIEKKVDINAFSINSSVKTIINLNEEFSEINYNYSSLNESNNNYIVDINHNKENTKSNVISHAINFTDKKLDFLINTNIPESAKEIISNQDSKIILRGNNNSVIKPNLIVNNSMITANHSAYIGSFKKNNLFYLESRGLEKNIAEKILAKAFLINKMKLSFREKELVINKLNEYWR